MDLTIRSERRIPQVCIDCGKATDFRIAPRLLARFHALDEVLGVLIETALAWSYSMFGDRIHFVERFAGFGACFGKNLPPTTVNN